MRPGFALIMSAFALSAQTLHAQQANVRHPDLNRAQDAGADPPGVIRVKFRIVKLTFTRSNKWEAKVTNRFEFSAITGSQMHLSWRSGNIQTRVDPATGVAVAIPFPLSELETTPEANPGGFFPFVVNAG